MNKTSNNSIDWREIVYRGVESQTLDYKAAQNWVDLSRAGKAKFARHAMAMANTKGGCLVVGVGEDEKGNPTLHTGLTERQLKSFDPSMVGQFINLFADPSIDFDIARPEIDGKFYAIFIIRRFSGLPHVCSDHCGYELQQGVFYIRTPDARSRPAFRASELHGLVQRALRNQREVLGRMLRGVLYEGRQYPEADAEQEFAKLLQSSKENARKWLGPRNLGHFCNLEIVAYPADPFDDDVDLSDLKKAAETVALPVPGDLPFLPNVNDNGELFLTNQSLIGRHASKRGDKGKVDKFHFWQFYQSGMFHYLTSISELVDDGRRLVYPHLVNRIGCAIELIGELYSELGLDDEILTFTVGLNNVEKCVLTNAEEGTETSTDPLQCYIPEIVVRKRRSVADLTSDPAEHATRVTREVCERFNLPSDRHPQLRQQLARLLQ